MRSAADKSDGAATGRAAAVDLDLPFVDCYAVSNAAGEDRFKAAAGPERGDIDLLQDPAIDLRFVGDAADPDAIGACTPILI
jgi:hypothetical protein